MLVKEITYTDYKGQERTEEFYFNFSKSEIAEMELSVSGGYSDFLRKMVNEKDTVKLMEYFKKLILDSYGEIAPDGKRFMKSAELSEAFYQTEAYTELFMSLITDTDSAVNFVNSIMPKALVEIANKVQKQNPESEAQLTKS